MAVESIREGRVCREFGCFVTKKKHSLREGEGVMGVSFEGGAGGLFFPE